MKTSLVCFLKLFFEFLFHIILTVFFTLRSQNLTFVIFSCLGCRREHLPLEGPEPESCQAKGLESNFRSFVRIRDGCHGGNQHRQNGQKLVLLLCPTQQETPIVEAKLSFHNLFLYGSKITQNYNWLAPVMYIIL